MPIDIDKALAAEIPSTTFSWNDDDIILYHLGIGAGDPPTDERELRYAYEGDLHVIPTYATIPPFSLLMGLGVVEGLDITLAQILHGEQETMVHSVIPTRATVVNTGRVAAIYDKGKGALVVIEVVSTNEKTGEPLFTNRAGVFVRGEGGFGGEGGPAPAHAAPERAPDEVVESSTLPQQALLYRLSSGDRNPLHADPGFAAFAGFEKPILHGLCTYGVVAKAVIDSVLGGRPEDVGSYRARFAGVVYPGETVVTRIWDEGDHFVIAADTEERGTPVISNAALAPR